MLHEADDLEPAGAHAVGAGRALAALELDGVPHRDAGAVCPVAHERDLVVRLGQAAFGHRRAVHALGERLEPDDEVAGRAGDGGEGAVAALDVAHALRLAQPREVVVGQAIGEGDLDVMGGPGVHGAVDAEAHGLAAPADAEENGYAQADEHRDGHERDEVHPDVREGLECASGLHERHPSRPHAHARRLALV